MESPKREAAIGISGLDDVLGGGLERGRVYLFEGPPGAGKTTIALQFLMTGAELGERCLYITLSETADELRTAATSHGWSLEGVDVFELVPPESLLDEEQQQSLLYSSDLELGETTKRVFEAFERVKPDRVVLDSLSEIRLLAQSSLRYRRQILALKHYFARQNATVVMLDDLTGDSNDKTVHSVAHGVIRLDELAPEYGAERRRLRVIKYRGRRFRGGYHDFAIETGGVRVFPRLVSAEHKGEFARRRSRHRFCRVRRLAGRRRRARFERAGAGSGRNRQVDDRADVRQERGRTRREGGDVRVRRGTRAADRPRAQGLGIDLQAMVDVGLAAARAGRRRRTDARRVLRARARLRRKAWSRAPS